MAEIAQTSSRQQKAGVSRMIKQSTRVDLTPMVDLGFLLITFFIFTTTLAQPTAMKMMMPDDRGDDTPAKESGAVTLLLGDNDSLAVYEGQFDPANPKIKRLSVQDTRPYLIQKKKNTPAADLLVIIKPGNQSRYKNVVDVLDEMTINDIRRYALVEITAAEQALINNR